MDNSVIVSLRDIVVEFDGQRILDGLNLDIHDKEFVTLLGSSGCAGDCSLAACLHKWYRDRDNVEEAMKLAMATGANVAESVGIGDFGHVDEYSKRVAVRKLDRQ